MNRNPLSKPDLRALDLLLLAAWLALPLATVYARDHLDRRIVDWNDAHGTASWVLLHWPHRAVDVLVALLLPAIALCIYNLWKRRDPPWLAAAIDGSAALLLVLAFKTPLKALFGRTWPDTFYHGNPSYLDHGVYGFAPLSWDVAYWAFPSGHSAEIVAVALAIGWHHRRAGYALALLSLLVMADLILLNYHWLSDAVGGTLFGLTAAAAIIALQLPQQLLRLRGLRLRSAGGDR